MKDAMCRPVVPTALLMALLVAIASILSGCDEETPVSSDDFEAVSPPKTFVVDLENSCTAADAWVEDHQAELPSTWKEVSRYPMAYRRSIFSEMTSVQRFEVWKDHLAFHLGPEGDLSGAQQDHVRAVLKNLSPQTFEDGPEAIKAIIDVEKVNRLFETKQVLHVFRNVGYPHPLDTRVASETAERTVESSKDLLVCECRPTRDGNEWCRDKLDDSFAQCYVGDCQSSIGCGYMNSQSCTGKCGLPGGGGGGML